MPRRNNGPIVQLDLASGTAISVQYTGFSATREIDAIWTWNHARDLADFRRGLQWFDSGTQNFAYADVQGNIAYFATAEVPVREDLQATPSWACHPGSSAMDGRQRVAAGVASAARAGDPLRDPARRRNAASDQSAAGWFVNANNDPAGTVLDNDPLNSCAPAAACTT